MENDDDFRNSGLDPLIEEYICLSKFRKPLFWRVMKQIIPKGSKGLDAGCGIGYYTKILADVVGKNGQIIGLDLSDDLINYAIKQQTQNMQFELGDVNSLKFNNETFDWIWSADTVWPGPKELGCPAEYPTKIIQEFYRVLKPGGFVLVLFWSTQKFLTGYPLLEARLNTTSGATAPFVNGMNPMCHVMNIRYWLDRIGFKNNGAKTFIADINAPLNQNTKKALHLFFHMLWGEAENQLSKKDWEKFKQISDPDSEDCVLNNPYYYGFYTYTVFIGIK